MGIGVEIESDIDEECASDHNNKDQKCLLPSSNRYKTHQPYESTKRKSLVRMSIRSKFREIFPSKWLFLFFLSYTLLYIISAILVRLSSNSAPTPSSSTPSNSSSSTSGHTYSYDTVSVVLLTELLKLVLNTVFYIAGGGSLYEFVRLIFHHRRMALYYLIPSGLYGLYNNLTYVSLSVMDPATYYILLQFRIAVTAVIYQILFKRDLSRTQWLSLVLLTLGCIIKQIPTNSGQAASFASTTELSFVFIAIQIFCSCFAGVYNEYLLKNKQDNIAQVELAVQNVYMYADSILVNFVAILARFLLTSSSSSEAFTSTSTSMFDFSMFEKPIVWAIIVTSALCGLSTSYFIKAFNSIMKSYATGVELLLTAVICWFLFSIPITAPTVISICVVSYATYLFAKHPVISK